MPWAFLDENGHELYRLPASLWPDQRHVGGSPRARFVRGYGSEDWFVTRDGLREAANVTIVGLLQTDRDEAGTQALISELVSAASEARYLGHLDASGVVVEVLPLLGALPITTEPDGVDGSMVVVTLPLVPGGEWMEFIPPPAPDEYTYEVFTESGVWDWNAAGQPDEVDVLVVAGGGGGGSRQEGGGGGAGGLRIELGVPVNDSVPVIVGSGGTGGSSGAGQQGGDGEASSFGGIAALGGGGGGASYSGNPLAAGRDGGSGGGGGRSGSASYRVGGSGEPGQGHDGAGGGSVSGGGGGGAASAGSPGGNSAQSGGDGGAGISLATVGFVAPGAPDGVAGGGGGAQGGAGSHGGGSGSTGTNAGQHAQANTGSGGGGGGRSIDGGGISDQPGGDGGSGLVIVRWRQDG